MSAQTAHDLIELNSGPVTPVLSRALRAMLIAKPGRKLVGADFSGIEARVSAWMSGEEWKLQAFRDFDAGTGPNLYNLAYARAFGIPAESIRKGSTEYDIGKKAELSCGYQGAIGAYLRFSPRVDGIAKTIKARFYGTESWRKAEDQYASANNRYKLSADEWISVKIVVNAWRESNPRIVQSWWDRQDAAVAAVDAPGARQDVCDGKISYLAAEGFLWCRLPSGKLLAYCRPRLVETREDFLVDADGEMFPADEFTADEIAARVAGGATLKEGRRRTQVQFDGTNQKTRQWGPQRLYGGLQCNNDVQGTARELLRFAMHNVEAAGYEIVMHTHDDLAAEVAQEFGSIEHFAGLMSIVPDWIRGLPLAVKGWSGRRYAS